jgi:hypothetical protein
MIPIDHTLTKYRQTNNKLIHPLPLYSPSRYGNPFTHKLRQLHGTRTKEQKNKPSD